MPTPQHELLLLAALREYVARRELDDADKEQAKETLHKIADKLSRHIDASVTDGGYTGQNLVRFLDEMEVIMGFKAEGLGGSKADHSVRALGDLDKLRSLLCG